MITALLDELEKVEKIYMMVDAVIQIRKVQADGSEIPSGWISSNGQYSGDLYFHENYKELNKTFTNKKYRTE